MAGRELLTAAECTPDGRADVTLLSGRPRADYVRSARGLTRRRRRPPLPTTPARNVDDVVTRALRRDVTWFPPAGADRSRPPGRFYSLGRQRRASARRPVSCGTRRDARDRTLVMGTVPIRRSQKPLADRRPDQSAGRRDSTFWQYVMV